MKKTLFKPLAVLTITILFGYGCASSSEETATVSTESPTVEESITTDDSGLDVLVIQEQVTVPIATLPVAVLAMENTVDVNDMFEDIDDTEKYDVLALAKTSPNLSTFVRLIEQAELADDIQRVEKVTLFAPTNEAFAKMPKDKLESLLKTENIALLSRFLQTHILASDVSSVRLKDNDRIRLTESTYIPIETMNTGSVMIGGSHLVNTDIEASNGRIHVIDSVLMPSEDIREEGMR